MSLAEPLNVCVAAECRPPASSMGEGRGPRRPLHVFFMCFYSVLRGSRVNYAPIGRGDGLWIQKNGRNQRDQDRTDQSRTGQNRIGHDLQRAEQKNKKFPRGRCFADPIFPGGAPPQTVRSGGRTGGDHIFWYIFFDLLDFRHWPGGRVLKK